MALQGYPTESVESGWELLAVMGGGVALLVVFFLISTVRQSLRDRKGKRIGRWPTTKVRRLDGSLWYWTCWYCEEESTGFPSHKAAEQSARHHTDHVDREG